MAADKNRLIDDWDVLMKYNYLKFIINCMFVCLAIHCYGKAAEYPFAIELIEPKNLLVGERANLQIKISNISDKPVEFVEPLDGSWHHWRYPYMSVEIYDENSTSLPVKLGARCGNMNPIVLEDIQRLNPGEAKDFSVGWPSGEDGFEKPGKYSIIFTYDMRAPDMKAWVIAGRFSKGKENSKIAALIERVPKLIITSKPLGIKVNSVTKNMITSMIVKYYLGRERPLFDFVADDLKHEKWLVRDIRQSHGHISCLIEFVDGYKPPPRPKYVTEGYWFEEGRYLFEPYHGKSAFEKLHALSEDTQTSVFELYLPKDVAILAKKHEWLQGLVAEVKATNPIGQVEDDKKNHFGDTPKTIDTLVSEIVTRAKSHDIEFFNKLLDSQYKGQEQKLIDMILRSDMSNNFKERLEDKNSTQARLNYHYLEKGVLSR